MTKMTELIQEHGFIATVRGFANRVDFHMLEEQLAEHGPLKGIEWFESPAPGGFEDHVGTREGANSGPYFYGPFADGWYIQLWFMAAGPWRRIQNITYNWVDYNPRECHYHPGCDHDWEDDDEGCDYCEVDTDMCTEHNTYH